MKSIFRQILNSIKQGKYYLFSTAIDVVAIFIFNLLIARSFDPAIYGQIKTVLAVTAIFLAAFDLGLPVLLQNESAKGKTLDSLGLVLFIKLVSVFLYSAFVLLYFAFTSPDIDFIIVSLVLLSSYLMSFCSLLFSLFYGKDKISYTFNSIFVSRALLLLVSLLLTKLNTSVYYFLVVFLLNYLTQLVILAYESKKIGVSLKLNNKSIKDSLKLIKAIFPLALTTLFCTLYSKLDVVLVARYLNFDSVAQYNIPYGIYKLSGIVFTSFTIPAFNAFSRNENIQSNFKILRSNIYIMIVVSILIDLGILLLGKEMIILLYGDKYLLASEIMPYFSVSVLGLGLNSITGVYCNALRKYKVTLFTTLGGIIVNVFLNVILIPRTGVMGAVYSSMVTEMFVFAGQYYYIKQHILKPSLHITS
ncbi:MAG: polysaccharide biosynthesis C-terminal domain-containing protein [Bacteroidota bacterium]|nr:polysaccharide biosynthesis C-terminal domain-containing protein [Bacteroidota bacterium]MDP4194719.1 polysaccharide biosynthesis C-terminal domain-containing protein [Bacteroidota bacterium]